MIISRDYFDERINELLSRIEEMDSTKDKENEKEKETGEPILRNEIVRCDNCRCLLYKSDALVGDSEIRKRFVYRGGDYGIYEDEDEYIYKPYYCVRCYREIKSKKSKKK